MSQALVATVAVLGGVVAALVDGRRAVRIAALAAGVALAPAAGAVGAAPGALVPLVAGAATVVVALAAEVAAQRMRRVPGLDPVVPVVAPAGELFGPRSVRAASAGLALVAASWVGINVEVGGAATAHGAVFAAAYLWLVGTARLLRARAIEDLAVGAAVVGIAGSTGWLLEAGTRALGEAAALAAVAPLAGAVAGWMAGRHRRRPAPEPA